MKEEIQEWIQNNSINEVVEYVKKLDESKYIKTINELIDDLKTTNENDIRDTIAIVLSDLRCNEAVIPLISLIFDSRCQNHRGTLLYALEQLDSSDYIVKLLPLIYEGKFETRWSLRFLLQEKISEMKRGDINECKDLLSNKIEEYEEDLQVLYDVAENIFGMSFDEE